MKQNDDAWARVVGERGALQGDAALGFAAPARSVFAAFSAVATLAIIGILATSSSLAAPTEFGTKTVLFISSERSDMPAMRELEETVREVFHDSADPEIELFPEYLDFARFPVEHYGGADVKYLRERYAAQQIDLILVTTGFSLDFVLSHRDELFPKAPIVFCAAADREITVPQIPPNVTGVVGHFDIERTLKLIFALQPNVTEIACVGGTSGFDRFWEEETRKVLERFTDRTRFRWITDGSLKQTTTEVSKLSPSAAVFYISMLRDGGGHSMTATEAVGDLCRASKAPVYGLTAHFLNAGTVGGAVFDFAANGRKAADLALRVLRGEWVPVGSPELEIRNPLAVNWAALRKWNLTESLVPADAEIRHLPPSLWETHRPLILWTTFLVLIQSALIIGLLTQRLWRRRAERALHEFEERVALAAEAAHLGAWELNIKTNKLWLSDKARELFQFPPNVPITIDTFHARTHPEDRAVRDAAFQKAVEMRGGYEIEYQTVLPDKKVRWIHDRAQFVTDDEGALNNLLGVSMDVTERKQAEEQARKSRDDIDRLTRISLLGEMTASIAHELNQPLSAIVSNANAAQRFLQKGQLNAQTMEEILEDVGADARRAHDVIQHIRNTIKKGAAVRERINLNKVIDHVARSIRPDARIYSCEIQTSLDPSLPEVEGDPVQIQQVLINLVSNAFDAMSQSPAKERKVEIKTERNGDGTVCVSVRDHGVGIRENARERLFEQFFTTKDDGLGMGLAIVRSIIEAHGGRISAENVDDGGARFRFSLPLALEKIDGAMQGPAGSK